MYASKFSLSVSSIASLCVVEKALHLVQYRLYILTHLIKIEKKSNKIEFLRVIKADGKVLIGMSHSSIELRHNRLHLSKITSL